MAERDASKVQLDFPELTADLIRQLRLTGTVGLLELLDQVRPVYIVAQREGALSITVAPPIFNSSAIFTGAVTDPLANTNIFDTGPLPAGDYDIFAGMGADGTVVVPTSLQIEHRNAADAANLAILLQLPMTASGFDRRAELQAMRYSINLNERFRFRVPQNFIGRVNGTMGVIIVPTP